MIPPLSAQTSPVTVILSGLSAFGMSAVLTWLIVQFARRFSLHVHPNERSSHTVPTPQLGGIAVAAPILVYAFTTGDVLFLASGTGLFALGLYDDLADLSPFLKLACQFALVLVPTLILGTRTESVGLFDVLATCVFSLWLVGFVNVFNFMDGMNGKAGVFSLVVLAALSIMLFLPGERNSHAGELLPFAVVFGATAGFLLFNCRSNAAIFLGDSGSHILGYSLAYIALESAILTDNHTLNPLAVLVVFVPFLFDSSWTLLRRTVARKPFWKAHREHLYQRMMVAGMSHMRTLRVCFYTYVICAGLAVVCEVAAALWLQLLILLLAIGVMTGYGLYVRYVERSALDKALSP